jgi:hypothetical protein
MRRYQRNEDEWNAITPVVKTLKDRIDQSLKDVTDYNSLIWERGGEIIFVTKEGNVPIDAKYWKAFDEVKQQFDGRNSVLMQMDAAKSPPTRDQVQQWYVRLYNLHFQLKDASGPLLSLLP